MKLSHQSQERITQLQDDMKNELDKAYQQHQKDLESYEHKVNRLRDEKANQDREVAKAMSSKNAAEVQVKQMMAELDKSKHEKNEIQN